MGGTYRETDQNFMASFMSVSMSSPRAIVIL
jgi:hypothetical protein